MVWAASLIKFYLTDLTYLYSQVQNIFKAVTADSFDSESCVNDFLCL